MNTSSLAVAQIGFILLTLIYIALFLRKLFRGVEHTSWTDARKKNFRRNWVAGTIVWGLFVTAWSASGVMADFSLFPLNFMPVIAIPLIAMLVLTFSSSMKEVLQAVPVEELTGIQSFRFFVEILLWVLFTIDLVPVQMTFEGFNLDILSGITAPLVVWLISRKKIGRVGLICWNVVCLGFLINIVTIAILSTPTPLRVFMNEPANRIVTYFPVSLLPGFLVPLAYTLHFFSLRKLLSASPATAAQKVPM